MREAICHTLAKELSTYLSRFAEGFVNVPSPDARQELSTLLLARLLLIYDLQVAGCLDRGDRWYLHTQLGQSAESASGTFFKTFLQPLCQQGFGLPPQERSQSLQQRIGAIPYLGGALFQAHPLEQRSPHLDLPDEPIELFLGWLAEQLWQRHNSAPSSADTAITPAVLAGAFEYLITERTGKGLVSTPETLRAIARQTVDAYLLRETACQPIDDLDTLLHELNDERCLTLVTDVLPNLTVLDPACGSGRFLVLALDRLQATYQACWQYAQTSPHPNLQDWVRSLQPSPTSPLEQLTRNILTHTLYGVDRCPAAVTLAQLQLWLRLLATAPPTAELSPLPDLDFNLTVGNALVGFVRVDAESFDQIPPKRTQSSSETETVWQGNLLQPLAAANYRDTLSEKKIRVEHYQAQTTAMGREGGIPEYAQTEFLRDRVEAVNQSVQHKLNTLLFETWSRKLGIYVKEPQFPGRTRKRLLTLDDIEALEPFHWGFFFNHVMEQRGGFDVILTHPPDGSLSPKVDDFYHQHRSQCHKLNLTLKAFRRSRRRILQQHPDLAALWSLHAGRISALKDYVRRSDDYALPVTTVAQRSISLKLLYSLRCAQLANLSGIPPYVHEA